MAIVEKYPEEVPWDLDSNLDKSVKLSWILTKGDNVYSFKQSIIDNQYIYIQKNHGQKKAVKELIARFTYQRLFDEGYLLAVVA